MMAYVGVVLLVFALGAANGATVAKNADTPKTGEAYFNRQILEMAQVLLKNPDYQYQQPEKVKEIPDIDDIVFDCPYLPPSSSPPTTVHQLRPGDIKIIGALGDSITAGNGMRAETPVQILIPTRGESFSVGGDKSLDDGIVTITNILRKYNPNVIGYSLCAKTRRNKDSGFNVAVPGDTNRGLADQASELINKLLTYEGVDYYNDWKLITLFIGGNDLCRSCTPLIGDEFSPESYRDGIKAALDLLHRHVPRAFVNVQTMLDVSMVEDLRHPGAEAVCDDLHQLMCPCAMKGHLEKEKLRLRQFQYWVETKNLIDSGIYDNRSDFTVVLQPHLRDQKPFTFPNGTYDMSYIAPDCFHPNAKCHRSFAFMLWNVMLTPVGQKPYEFSVSEHSKYFCPTEEKPYFYTSQNSNLANKKATD